MLNVDFKKFPIILYDADLEAATRSGYAVKSLIKALEATGLSVTICADPEDTLDGIYYNTQASCVIFDWDSFDKLNSDDNSIAFIKKIRKINSNIPIFLLSQNHEIDELSEFMLSDIAGFIWKYDDTPDFVAGRIKQTCVKYLVHLLPPFFRELVKYTLEYKYAWHTPGHMGGIAFLKSPTGRLFYDFYGENAFRSDLSISVPELGSLLEHSGVVGEAERFAAETFGADSTYFVTNGTSTSNKMVLMSRASHGDVAIIDRNCHKSLQHALTMSNVTPIYFKPTRNAYGIIGGIPLSEFTKEVIQDKINKCPLIKDKNIIPAIAVVTNSTYDGLIYNVENIKELLADSEISTLHFDEAWFPYAHFHPLYKGKYAMSGDAKDYHPTIFSTQSTHKLLAAFSQASMLHIKNGIKPVNHDLFNETYMMHTSTSPQYSIIASLDVSSKMMSGDDGPRLIGDSISEAVAFRQEFVKVNANYNHGHEQTKDSWSFKVWQPDKVMTLSSKETDHFSQLTAEDSHIWALDDEDNWHGFKNIDDNHMFLDPIKVTVITPGINVKGEPQTFGIPASIVAQFLMKSGVVDEKTGFYTLLFLFSIGVNKSKAMTLLSKLQKFKTLFDEDVNILQIFPHLVQEHPNRYGNLTIQLLSEQMHAFLTERNACHILMRAYDELPEQVKTPSDAYENIVHEQLEEVPLDKLIGRTVLNMVAPYPPGIPIIMPGERLTESNKAIIDFLQLLEAFDAEFPGFESEVHGAEIRMLDGKRRYVINCVKL
jgi:arginine decarboxylase